MALGNKKPNVDNDEYIELISTTGIAHDDRELQVNDE
jgi:hypothetical protein